MKTSLKLLLATLALAVGFSNPSLLAQEQPPSPPPPESCGPSGKNPHEGLLVMLADELSLTETQITQVKAVLDEEKTALDALRQTTPDREAAHTKMEAIIKAQREKIRALLTADQQKIFDQLKPRGHRGPPPPPGVPSPVQD